MLCFLPPPKDETAPTVVWQQGGPGGSSLIGFLTEMGPFTLNDFSFSTEAYLESGIPTVFTNHWSWHTAPANFLFVEHPAPTGFSYCEGKCDWDDTKQAEANYAFYVHFFKEFPELAKNDFFISGESYAGRTLFDDSTFSLNVLPKAIFRRSAT